MTIESLLRVDGGTSLYLFRWKHRVKRFATGVLSLASLLFHSADTTSNTAQPPKKEGRQTLLDQSNENIVLVMLADRNMPSHRYYKATTTEGPALGAIPHLVCFAHNHHCIPFDRNTHPVDNCFMRATGHCTRLFNLFPLPTRAVFAVS